MTKLYFDNQKGIILLNGLPVKSPAFADKEFVIEYFPFDKNLMCVKHAVDCRLTSFEDMLVIKHDDSLIIKFCPLRIHEYDDCYISKQIKCGDTVHILTCKADREHKIILESQYEIINIPLPAKADDVSIKAKTISSGQLLLIKAIIGKKPGGMQDEKNGEPGQLEALPGKRQLLDPHPGADQRHGDPLPGKDPQR